MVTTVPQNKNIHASLCQVRIHLHAYYALWRRL